MHVLQNAGWDTNLSTDDNKNFVVNDKFSGCIPLKHLFGFCEDYKKILLNCNQQLILNRASTDFDALYVSGLAVTENIVKNKKVSLTLNKILW